MFANHVTKREGVGRIKLKKSDLISNNGASGLWAIYQALFVRDTDANWAEFFFKKKMGQNITKLNLALKPCKYFFWTMGAMDTQRAQVAPPLLLLYR